MGISILTHLKVLLLEFGVYIGSGSKLSPIDYMGKSLSFGLE